MKLNRQQLFGQMGYVPHAGQLAVHKSKAKRRILICGTRFGKSLCAAMECLAAALEPRKRSMIWVVAPTMELSDKVFREVVIVVAEHLKHRLIELKQHDKSIILRNLGGGVSQIRGKTADNPVSLLGEGLDLVVVDEASRLKPAIWHSFLAQRLVDKNGSALLISTPKGRGYLWDMWKRGQPGGDPDYESWNLPSWANPHLDRALIEKERERLPDAVFRQEFGAEWIEGVGSVFRGVREAATGDFEEPVAGKRYVAGLDLAKINDYTALTILDRNRRVVHFQRFHRIAWDLQVARVKTATDRYNHAEVNMDATGVGDPLFDLLRKAGIRTRGYKFTGTTSANINSDSSDVVSYAYNAQGQVIYQKDQAGSVFETVFDDSGRELHRRVTTLASGFDGAVRRISRTFDNLGRPSLVTQYDNATVGSGSVTDEVSYYEYDGWGGLTKYRQDKDSAVGGSGYYEMAYTYEKALGGRNTMRRDTMTLPGGFVVTITYGNDKDDSISRVSRLKDGATTLVKYNYLGVGRVVGSTYQEPNIARTEYVTSSDSYTGHLDNFNRVVNSCWWTLAPNPDKKFYDCDVSYDRNSNITWVEDNVHDGFDVKYTMDDLDRLIDAEEGTRSSGSIASRTRHQTWLQSSTSQLGHTGNWKRSKLDLDGDDNWNEASEYDDTRTHNTVNELTARDTDTNGSNNYTLAYDAAGNMTDDGESYKYEYDAFYRLRKVKNQSSTLLAEYRYNGLGHMIGVHEDTDSDGDADSNDKWFYPAYDERWREVARYRESDSSPKEQFVNATAGLDGYGGSSYINDVVCRNRDANTAWTSASDGTLEERYYLCQNWRGDVSALIHSGRYMGEWDKYSPYGIPFGLPGGDTNSDGDNDAADATQIQTWINGSAYDVRGDVDLDGDVDSTDKTLAQGVPVNGNTLAWGRLSDDALRNIHGLAGYIDLGLGGHSGARRRVFLAPFGRWGQRDPSLYVDGVQLYAFANGSPVGRVDFSGLRSIPCGTSYTDTFQDAETLFYSLDELWYITPEVFAAEACALARPFAEDQLGTIECDDPPGADICSKLTDWDCEVMNSISQAFDDRQYVAMFGWDLGFIPGVLMEADLDITVTVTCEIVLIDEWVAYGGSPGGASGPKGPITPPALTANPARPSRPYR